MQISQNRTLTFTLHILAWLVLVILPQVIINRYWGSQNFIAWGFYINAAVYGIIFYINYLLLVPQLFFNNKRAIYAICAASIITLFFFVNHYLNEVFIHNIERDRKFFEAMNKLSEEGIVPKPPLRQMQVYYFIITSTLVSGFALGLKVVEKHIVTEKKQKELEQEKLNSELAFLKNQVSPHFFFNTLNNIYALIQINSTNAQASVLKLSKLMRYLLYDSEDGKTALKQEVDFMTNYIDLMRLRVSPKVKFDIELPENHLKVKIPPLLFIAFIENAFKHGISYRENSFIKIKMKTDGHTLHFNCINSINKVPDSNMVSEGHSGIGLENIKKRLQLLYPQKHELNIFKTEEQFNVQLTINIT